MFFFNIRRIIYFGKFLRFEPGIRKKSMSELGIQNMIRNNKATTKSKFPPAEMYLSVLGNGSESSARALFMFTDRQKYLFNCGEGTQRLANEHRMKISKMEHVFLTYNSWENIGGLLGLTLTMKDAGVQELTVHAPPGIDLLYECSESFVNLPDFKIDIKTYSDLSFSDDCLDISYIPIFKSQNSETIIESEDCQRKSKSACSGFEGKVGDIVMAYACKGHSKPGRILLEKCVEQGVPVGPLLGDLKNGKDVTLPSGKIVYSKDVVTEEQICPLFLVVECPSEEFLGSFVNEKKFQPHQEDTPQLASLVAHFTPSEILNSPRYQAWMQKFPSTTCHLVLNRDCSTVNSVAVHRIQHQLHLIHPDIFSLLHEKEGNSSSPVSNTIFGNSLERYYLRPAKGLDRSFALKLEPESYVKEAENNPDFKPQLEKLQNCIKDAFLAGNDELFPEVTFLGTGSCIPSKARNVSAILVQSSTDRCLLMDCGEGTHGQLVRLHGDGHRSKLSQLFCIFISHMHADHHLGLIKTLNERQKLVDESQNQHGPVYLVGPPELDAWLQDYYKHFEKVLPNYKFVECFDLEENYFGDATILSEQEKYCQDIKIATVPVVHCKNAYGAVISSKSQKWKLVYSGDSMPCGALISAGKDCSLLIHEATMEDDLAEEAAAKKHSTTSQAIQVARKMGAKCTILTHFSQRYAKVPLVDEKFHGGVGCAFDNMKVSPSRLYVLPLLLPVLQTLFAPYIEELHTKTDKRKKRETVKHALLSKKLCTAQR